MSKVVIITLCLILLVGLVVAVVVGYSSWGKVENEDHKVDSTMKAVQGICQPTDYKEACFKSMSDVKTDDPKELVRAAFKSARDEINLVAHNSTVLKELEKDPKAAEAVRDCKELFGDAMDDLQRSFDGFDDFEWNNKVNDALANIKTWLSASITYQETCIDGFKNTTGDAGRKVRRVLKMAMEMSSNGLAIVTDMSSMLASIDTTSFNRRRLLSDQGPLVVGHDINYGIPYRAEKHDFTDQRRKPYLGARVNGQSSEGYMPDWLDYYPYRNRKLLNTDKSLLFEDDIRPYDEDELPLWLRGDRRWLLHRTKLANYLKKRADIVVAKDGSGKYKSIGKALKRIPKNGQESFIIYIKEGVYKEYLTVEKWMTHVVFIGDGPTKTRITNNKNFYDGTKTFKTASVSVLGEFFMAKDIGFENTAGAKKHQAVALRVQADRTIFYNCHMDGYQDTLYVHTYRQFYRDCSISGTIDFIFGNAAAFFQNCVFVIRKPLPNQQCIVTAQGRVERHQPTGIIIHRCRFEPDPEYYPLWQKNKAYLGRPWKEYSRTIIMESHIGGFIQPDGWLPWEEDFGLDTCYYTEFNNAGPGAKLANRVKWRGVKVISFNRAERFMPLELFENDTWILDSGIPYDPSLSIASLAPGMAPAWGPAWAPSPFMDDFFGGSSEDEEEEDDDVYFSMFRSDSNKGEKSSSEKHDGQKKSGKEDSSEKKHKEQDKDKGDDEEEKSRHEDDSESKENGLTSEGDQFVSHAPAVSPIEAPALAPIEEPALAPVEGPALAPIEGPALATIKGPALARTEGPALARTEGPALARTEGPALAPIERPAFAPIEGPSMAPSDVFFLDDSSSIAETLTSVDVSEETGGKPVEKVAMRGLERLLMVNNVGKTYALFNDNEEKKPLTILELENVLMGNEEEPEHKTSLSLALSAPRKDPIQVDEMERMLMANEDIYGDANDEATSISVPPTTAPSPTALSPNLGPSIAEWPSLGPSIASEPSLGPSIAYVPSLGPSIENGPSPSPTENAPRIAPSENYEEEEVQEWLPPPVRRRPDTEELAPAPEVNKRAADEMDSDSNLGSKFEYEFHFMLSGLAVYIAVIL